MTEGAIPENLLQIERVIADPLRFKLKLGIGENAFRSVQLGRTVQELWGAGGVAVAGATAASSSAVAGTFFASSGWLASIGLGAAAVTPVGWVIGAALASGGAYYGVMRAVRSYSRSRVHQIPKFINSPVDLLAANLLDMLATLAVKLAQSDGTYEETERECLRDYFVQEWGFDEEYVDAAIQVVADGCEQLSLAEATTVLIEFARSNPDCNVEGLRREIVALLTEMAEADGHHDENEAEAIAAVAEVFDAQPERQGLSTRATMGAKTWLRELTARRPSRSSAS